MKMFGYLFLALCIVAVSADTCVQPKVTSSHYTSTNEKLGKDTAFVVQFKVSCKNNPKNLVLYADVDGLQYPVTKSPEGNDYQVSWTVKGRKTSSKSYNVRLFDDEGYNQVRKALRSENQDTSSIKELFAIEFQHPGISSGFWIKSEFVALGAAALFFYAVCKERSEVIG